MKIGRNERCFCGSGKKYKQCCLGKGAQGDGVPPTNAGSLADEIAQAAESMGVSSLDELQQLTSGVAAERNQWALNDFCGLSPEQMHCLLYAPFDSPGVIRFSIDIEPDPGIRIVWLFTELATALGEDGLKATATGNLPLTLCKGLAQRFRSEVDDPLRSRIGGIRTESDFEELHCVRLVAELGGLIRKYRGKFVLTRKCRDMIDNADGGAIYYTLFRAYATQFNWGYRDGYPEAGIVQQSFLFTLFLLCSFGQTLRPQSFYEDKFLTAFPMVVELFSEETYRTADACARQCYSLRALERFAVLFGLLELTPEEQGPSCLRYSVRKSALLDRLVTFSL